MNLIFFRTISYFYIILFFIYEKFYKSESENNKISKLFVKQNNKLTLKRISNKNIKGKKILILLPHCIQDDDCCIKITSDIDNCKICGKCDVGFIKKLKNLYGLNVKIATGGTLARKAVKELTPDLVIAVACERDLITGIFDSYPMPIYGIFNIRENGPCFNTRISQNELESVIKKIVTHTEEI